MIRIKMECWWTNSGALTDRFIKQFVQDEDLQKYSFVTEGEYDYLIVFGRTDFNNITVDKNKVLIFKRDDR